MIFKIYYDRNTNTCIVETEAGRHNTMNLICSVPVHSLFGSVHPLFCLQGTCAAINVRNDGSIEIL